MTQATPLRANRSRSEAVLPGVRDTFRRYRPGVYSATVETIKLTDGRSVRTDLIRLNPDIACYSVDLNGEAPRQVAHYTGTPWGQARELTCRAADVAAILRASYPALGLAELSARVRADGHPLGAANLQAHEAIAATQAALWHVTNGVALDTRAVAAPVAMAVWQDGQPQPVRLSPERPAWMGTVARDRAVRLQLTLATALQLGSYSVVLAEGSPLAGLRVHLERSSDGSAWAPVSSSTIHPTDPHVHKVLGVGATLSDGRGLGYAHYRIVVTTESPAPARLGIEQVRLAAAGVPAYPNPDRVVHLYTYLVCRLPRQGAPGEQVPVWVGDPDAATHRARLVGPIRVPGVAPGRRFGLRALDPGTYVVDAAGDPVFGTVTSTEPVFLRLPRRRSTPMARMAVTLPQGDLQPQLLLGSSAPGATPRFTPVVRLRPTKRETTSTFVMDVRGLPDRLRHVD
ncbi:MAG: TQXA domain-containing protein [Dermatophilaceae bacterium]